MRFEYFVAISLALFLTCGGGGDFFVSGQPLSCHKGCSKFGNCNQETGKCECPFGRTGASCHQDQLTACRLSPSGPAYCDSRSLQSCECLLQCHEYLCGNSTNCDAPLDLGPHRACYSFGNQKEQSPVSPSRQKSQTKIGVPYENETDVSYYRGYFPFFRINITYPEATIRDNRRSLPLDECPGQCNSRGACMQWADNLDALPECRCYHGFGVREVPSHYLLMKN